MTEDVRKKALQEFIWRIKKKYKVEKIIVFGSYARGEAREESDIDVLVVGDVKLEELIDESVPILLKYGVFISPHDITPERFEYLKREGTSFIKSVEREGVVYA
ncbi:nucleotidyltransferase family protein [Candidatus Pyrohabitans sp.]